MLGTLLLLAGAAMPPVGVQVENLEAFARLYGYVRFFHPSDEASRVDWEKLAVHGVSRVRNAQSASDLERALEEIFPPIAPTIRIFHQGQDPGGHYPFWPHDTEELSVIAWQHLGVGLGTRGIYDSIRTHRPSRSPVPGAPFGTITQAVPAAGHAGKSVRLRAAVKTDVEGSGNEGRLWLRVDRRQGEPGFFDNMSGRPIRTEVWKRFEIAGTIDEDAERVVFGGFLLGKGSLWLDGFELEVQDADGSFRPLPLANPGFESGAEIPGWNASSRGYLYRVDEAGCYEGARCARIDVEYRASRTRLFDAVPAVGEVTAASLPRGLSVEVPLALYGDAERTYGGELDARVTDELVRSVEDIDLDADPASRRVAAVVIAWNVFQHFYPYFDVVRTDWPSVLRASIQGALEAADEATFEIVLKRLLVELHDGHAGAYRGEANTGEAVLPFAVDWIENRIAVTRSETPEIERGDVVVSLDGRPAATILEQREALVSGSPQWRRMSALLSFGFGPSPDPVKVVVNRDGAELERTLPRSWKGPLPEARPESIAVLRDGIHYVDLTRAPFETVRAHVDELAEARAVVFDMRGYPQSGNHEILTHLADEPLRSAQWMVPQTIHPDGKRVGYDTSSRWTLPPSPPRLGGKIVFLTDAGAVSYGETLMGIVEHYRLGEIVGQPTAGTNGNVNWFTLPGGYRVAWTGMRVLKHDGSQHHLVGIRPTVPVERTLAGVREGKDEVLEKALSLLR